MEWLAICNGATVVFGMISAFESFPVESGCRQVVFVLLVDTCRLDASSLLLETVRWALALSADSDTLIWVNLTSSFDSWGTSVVLELDSVITDTAAVTEDGSGSESSESSSTSIFTTFEMKYVY